ncbi:MAG: PD-(D/E)XK nuclease domain-containing protein, partial [Candidatus Anaerobiospirillum pullicola]|nr:PD-(D/E)XK nuclease domain-containing protein [Candidatus Anaerobiospirillum pullicola]
LYYDGFCFDYLASVKLYSPWAINRFFDALLKANLLQDDDIGRELIYFSSFWMNSAGAAPALRSYLNSFHGDVVKLADRYSQPVVLDYEDMTSPVKATEVTLDQIMVQSGMISIQAITKDSKNAFNLESLQYECALTNYDVTSQYRNVLVAYISGQEEKTVKPHILQAHQALLAGDIAKMCRGLNQLLVMNSRYDIFDEQGREKEKVYRTLFRWCLLSDVVNTQDEVANNLGQCDLVATTKDTIYVFELKRVRSNTPKAAISMLNKAEKQMAENDYGNNLINQGKLVVWVVLVICDQYRQIRAWRTITKTKTAAGPHIERHGDLVELITVENQTVSNKSAGKGGSSKSASSKATSKAASSKATAKATKPTSSSN